MNQDQQKNHQTVNDASLSAFPSQPTLSLIIPVYNDATKLRQLLQQITRPKLLEIIVIDGGSVDDSPEVAQEFEGVSLLFSDKGRGRQIHCGIGAANGNYIWVLHADSKIPKKSAEEIVAVLQDYKYILGCFPIYFETSGFLLNIFAWMSRFDSPITTFGDQGLFFRKDDYEKIGEISACPLLEDVALRQRLLKLNRGRVYKSSRKLTTSTRRFNRLGALRNQIFNIWILLRYFCGASPAHLYEVYYGK